MTLPDYYQSLPDYPRPERAENGKPYYWRNGGYPTDRFLDEVSDGDLMHHMGIPVIFRSHVINMYQNPFADEVEQWLRDMPFIFRPAPSLQMKEPSLCGMGLLLWGEGGSRKTTTAAAILLRLIRTRIPNLEPNPLPEQGGTYAGSAMGRFVSWQDASEALRDAVGAEDDEETEGDSLRKSMRCESHKSVDSANFLVLDDISREKVTEWNIGELHRIMRFRHEYARPTIVTTNFSREKWVEAYGEVFAKFLDRSFFPVEFMKD